ncbi:MAG: post-transcriptional regulator [Bacilli bacterium]|nr:post-transcriptional regulator [Mollicutes bacterium]MDY6071979.1 post-transcriptional regulator [Bacilli bacterium]
MDNPIEFKSAKELYDRVLPALYSKVKEVRNLGFKYITEKDIWNYLVNNTWKTKRNLQLHDLISDILYADNYKLNDYVMDKMKKLKTRNDNVDEEML